MAYKMPERLTPTSISTFLECPLVFKFKVIDNIKEPPNLAAVTGITVHKVLEELFRCDSEQRHEVTARVIFESIYDEIHHQYQQFFDSKELEEAIKKSLDILYSYFEIENPKKITPLAMEMPVELKKDEVTLYGIIDRVDQDIKGSVVIVDYKTGRTPGVYNENHKMLGVRLYALMYKENFNVSIKEIKLIYLNQKTILSTTLDDTDFQFILRKVQSIWKTIKNACEQEKFLPRYSARCDFCFFKKYCPLFSGNPLDINAELASS